MNRRARSLFRPSGATLAAVLALACASCGGGSGPILHPVRGKVTHQGKPAAGALVVFHPVGNAGPAAVRPSALVGEDGSFSLTSSKPGDGAEAGQYQVTVIWLSTGGMAGGMGGGEAKGDQDRLRGRYNTPSTSGLTAEVKPGPNDLPSFELK
jgi:hypothetical protein